MSHDEFCAALGGPHGSRPVEAVGAKDRRRRAARIQSAPARRFPLRVTADACYPRPPRGEERIVPTQRQARGVQMQRGETPWWKKARARATGVQTTSSLEGPSRSSNATPSDVCGARLRVFSNPRISCRRPSSWLGESSLRVRWSRASRRARGSSRSRGGRPPTSLERGECVPLDSCLPG